MSPFFVRSWSSYQREWRVPGGLRFDLSDVQFLILPRGADRDLFRNPAPDVPLMGSSSVEFWNDALSALGDPEDHWEFLKVYADPIDFLNWDSEESDFVWIVDEVETRDGVATLFAELSDEATEQLAERLDQISPSWLRREDMDHIAD